MSCDIYLNLLVFLCILAISVTKSYFVNVYSLNLDIDKVYGCNIMQYLFKYIIKNIVWSYSNLFHIVF